MNLEGWLWLAWLLSFGVLETIALLTEHSQGTMTLTFFIEHHIPRDFLAMLLGWLTWHFLIAKGSLH